MDNKKGFTLIELLSVIAILAILMLLIMPNILKMFNKGKESAFKVQVESLIKTAEERVQSDFLSGRIYEFYCENGICPEELSLQSTETDLKYLVEISNNKAARLVIENKDYCYIGDATEEVDTDRFVKNGKIEFTNITNTGVTIKCGLVEVPVQIGGKYAYWNSDTAGSGVHYTSTSMPANTFSEHYLLNFTLSYSYPYVHARHTMLDENTPDNPEICLAESNSHRCLGAWITKTDFEGAKSWMTKHGKFDEGSCTETEESITCKLSNASCTFKLGEKAYCTDTVHTCTILPNEEIWCD